jgi:hypothetical protein
MTKINTSIDIQHGLERAFRETLRGHGIKPKNIPNLEVTETVLNIGDYFDVEAFRESHVGEVDNIDHVVHETYAPYWLYLTGVPEIELSEVDHNSPMRELDITVDITTDNDGTLLNTRYQRLLGCLLGDAVARRMDK